MARVFIGRDFEAQYQAQPANDVVVSGSDEQVLASLFGPSGAQVVGNDNDEAIQGDDAIVGADAKGKATTKSGKLVYEQWLPLTPANGITIAAGDSVDIELKPQRLFRPGVLSVPSAVAADVVMTACSIGQENQFVAQGGIPLECFATLVNNAPLSAQTAGPGVSITLSLHNTHATESRKIRGVWFGHSVVR
jgi:hypothetical protein